jgi:succinate-acetate transporter protein
MSTHVERARAQTDLDLAAREDGAYGTFGTRVVLSPIAAPSILGLAGFSVSTMMVATIMAKWWGSPTDLPALAPFCLFFGGLAQFMAGMWSYRARDGVATLAHGTWGAFWLAFGLLQLLQAGHVLPTPAPTATDLPFGLWFIGLAYITGTAALASLGESLGIFAVLSTLAVGSAFTAIGELTGGFASGWVTAAGWVFTFSAGFAWYMVTALLLVGVTGRAIVPLLKYGKAANVPTEKTVRPIELAWAEPGVKQGQ